MLSVWHFKPYYPSHDHHLWSIREQYRGSMYLFAALLALSRTREVARLVFLFILDFYLLWWGRWETSLFFLGATISQIDLLLPVKADSAPPTAANGHVGPFEKANDRKPRDPIPPQSPFEPYLAPLRNLSGATARLLSRLAWLVFFAVAFYLMSAPRFAYRSAPGYKNLSASIPTFYEHKETLMPSIGATMLLACLTRCTPDTVCYRVLTKPFALYLGKISFALYLVHGPMLHMYGYMFPHYVWALTGKSTDLTYGFGLIVGWAANLALVIWAADIYTREVDGRVVKVIQWVEGFCCVKAS